MLGQTSPLIIYAFLSLTVVAIYGNYMLLVVSVSMIVTSIFNGMNASIGNLIAEGNKDKILSFLGVYSKSLLACFRNMFLSFSFISFFYIFLGG